jgi:hypothetical protein
MLVWSVEIISWFAFSIEAASFTEQQKGLNQQPK